MDARDLDKERDAEDAIGYETVALLVAALVGATAWLVFVGQALVRQSMHEHNDAQTFAALGMTRFQLAAAAALRALPVAVAAVLIAMLTTAIASLESPIGVAAQAETDHGMRVDGVVMAVGAVTIAIATVVGLAFATFLRAPARRRAAPFTSAAKSRLAIACVRNRGTRPSARPPPRAATARRGRERDGGHCLWRRGIGPGRVGPPSGRAPEGVRHRMGRRGHRHG